MGRARAAVAHFWRKAYEDNLTGLASMVAYNLLLSIFPVALVALWVAGRVLRSTEVQDSVLLDLQQLFPSAAESTLSTAIRRLQETSTTAGILAIVAAVWFASSFWGALDTAFCQIYHRDCRSWVRQKLFALGMFAVVLLFIVASVAVPALQSLLVTSAERPAVRALRRARAGLRRLAGGGRRRPVRRAVRHVRARPERRDAVALRVAGRARRDAGDRRPRLRVPAVPGRTSRRCAPARRSCSC